MLALPSSPGPDHTESNSPVNQQSEPCEQKVENTTPLAELVPATVEDNATHQTVFLDCNRNLSFTGPSRLVDEAFIQQPLEDNTLLVASSTSELPRRPAERHAKNRDDNMAVDFRITRSNNITPQTVQKPPNAKPTKKSMRQKKPPVVKRHPNLEFPQTTTSDGQLDTEIPSQGHSAVPIDVDKLPDLKETIPPSKTSKRRTAAAATMDTAVTKPLDEPRRHENRSFEINMSPVGLKPESKKRTIPDVEDNEAIHVADQERSTKRTRIDPEKPSYPALPYQRKKYGRTGRTSSPRVEFPAISTIDFDEIPDSKPPGVVERPNSRASAMNGKRLGKKTEPKPTAPKKRKQDVKLDAKPIVPKVPVLSSLAKRDNQAKESLSEIDHHVRPLSPSLVSLTNK